MYCFNYTSFLHFCFFMHSLSHFIFKANQHCNFWKFLSYTCTSSQWSISLFIACIGEKFPFKLHEHKHFDNKLIIKYTKWSNEKTLKLINKKVSVRITLNLSLTISFCRIFFPFCCCSVVLAILNWCFNKTWSFVIALMEDGKLAIDT